MDAAERQEYHDLIQEETGFSPEKGQKWIMTLEEHHTYAHDIVFHVYCEGEKYMLLAYEIVDVMALDIKKRQHSLGDTLSGNFRILMSTLRTDLPPDMERDPNARDGSSFKLTFEKRRQALTYEWNSPVNPKATEFKRIQPILKLIWAVDEWKHGAKAMGWSTPTSQKPGEGKSQGSSAYGDKKKDDWGSNRREKSGKKGRIDPFGSIWEG